METPQNPDVEVQTSLPAQRVENALVRFLKSRLPGEKTERGMRTIDSLVSHLPKNGQELAAKVRPVIRAGMYAGNVVGTYMEAMLAASVGLGVVAIGKEGLRMIPVSPGSTEMKRKGLGGVWKDLNLGSIPRSLKTAVSAEASAFQNVPDRVLRSLWEAGDNLPWQKSNDRIPTEVTVVDGRGPAHRILAARKDMGKTGGALRYMYADWDTNEVVVAEVIRGKTMHIVGRRGTLDLNMNQSLTPEIMDILSQTLQDPLGPDDAQKIIEFLRSRPTLNQTATLSWLTCLKKSEAMGSFSGGKAL